MQWFVKQIAIFSLGAVLTVLSPSAETQEVFNDGFEDWNACTNVKSRCLDNGTVEFVTGVWNGSACEFTPTGTQACAADSCDGQDYVTESCIAEPYSASCVPSAQSCGPAEISACSVGMLTTTTNTCDASTGCSGTTGLPVTCPTASPACNVLDFTTYTPTCQSPTSCSATGAASTMTCTAPPDQCAGDVFVDHSATCSAAMGCGVTDTNTDCTAGDFDQCPTSIWTFRRGYCETGLGCRLEIGSINCRIGGQACLDADTVVQCPPDGSCSGTTCAACVITACGDGMTCTDGVCG